MKYEQRLKPLCGVRASYGVGASDRVETDSSGTCTHRESGLKVEIVGLSIDRDYKLLS
jgi:hypothetical protein